MVSRLLGCFNISLASFLEEFWYHARAAPAHSLPALERDDQHFPRTCSLTVYPVASKQSQTRQHNAGGRKKYSLIFATIITLSAGNPLGGNALVPRQTTTPFCSQAFASCTEISQRRSATFYCASLLGTTIETAVATHYTIVPLTCGGGGGGSGPSATDAAAATSSTKPHGQPTRSHPEPACLQPEQTDISSACSCLSLPPTVTTTTAGPTSTKTGPFSISASGGPFVLSTYSLQPTFTLAPTIYAGAPEGGYSPTFGNYRDEWYLTNHGVLEDFTAMKNFVYFSPYNNDMSVLTLGNPHYPAGPVMHCRIDDTTCYLTCTAREESVSYLCDSARQWTLGPSPKPVNATHCVEFQPVALA